MTVPLAALAFGVLCATAAAAQAPLRSVPGPPAGVPAWAVPQLGVAPSWCWTEIRLFDSLRTGPIDYCRKRLRYRPGALECYRIVDHVCATPSAAGQIVTGRTPLTREVLPCPRGPEPPVCRRLDLE